MRTTNSEAVSGGGAFISSVKVTCAFKLMSSVPCALNIARNTCGRVIVAVKESEPPAPKPSTPPSPNSASEYGGKPPKVVSDASIVPGAKSYVVTVKPRDDNDTDIGVAARIVIVNFGAPVFGWSSSTAKVKVYLPAAADIDTNTAPALLTDSANPSASRGDAV